MKNKFWLNNNLIISLNPFSNVPKGTLELLIRIENYIIKKYKDVKITK